MRDIRLIIFDLDGTLVNSSQDIVNAANFMLKSLNLKEKPAEEIVSYVGRGMGEFISNALGEDMNGLRVKAREVFMSYYTQHPVDTAYVYPGVYETLDYFKDKEKSVVTNRNHRSSMVILKKMGIADYFKNIIGDDNKICLKPNRCQIDRLFEISTVKDRGKALIVGDMDIDVFAGKAAGILTCAVTYGLGKRHDIKRAMPDYIIDEMPQLKRLIKNE
jgi:phosphoglycolate phosphatase